METLSCDKTHSTFLRVIKNLMDIDTLKALFLAFGGMIGSFIAPIWTFVIGAFALVAIDYVTGVKSARFKGEAVTSKKMRKSIDKALVYMLFIIAAHIVDILFKIPYDPCAYIAALAVARVEFFSIDENVRQLTTVSIKDNIKSIFEKK